MIILKELCPKTFGGRIDVQENSKTVKMMIMCISYYYYLKTCRHLFFLVQNSLKFLKSVFCFVWSVVCVS